MKFAISSHKDYFPKTKDKILSSLLDCGIDINNIFFFVGGMNKYLKISDSPNIFYVPHNSLDFTGLVSVVELYLNYPWWFLIHDTCFVGPNFYKKILEFNYDNHRCVRISGRHTSMNMGAYSWKLLEQRKKEVLKLKNTSSSVDKFKKYLIIKEDILFFHEELIFYEDCERNIFEPTDFYESGTPRKIFHYPEIDLYKVQANWIVKEDESYSTKL